MKSVTERMDINLAYREVGTYRGAADICGTTPKTVKRAVLSADAIAAGVDPVQHHYDAVRDIVVERVAKTKGRISTKRLITVARPAGYTGPPRYFRRLVAEVTSVWRSNHQRGRRLGVWAHGDTFCHRLGEIGPLSVFCAVLAWEPVARRVPRPPT